MFKIKKIILIILTIVMAISVNIWMNSFLVSAKNYELDFEEIATLTRRRNSYVWYIDNEGLAYYMSHDNKSVFIYTLDSKNKNIKNIFRLVDENNKGISVTDPVMKQCGDYIYLNYITDGTGKFKICRFVQLDKKLNMITQYDIPNVLDADTNGKKVVYIKGSNTIYISDINGKNKKKLYTVGKGNDLSWIDGVAINDRYVGFVGGTGYGNESNEYCGVIDLKNGKAKLFEVEQGVMYAKSQNNKILWYGNFAKGNVYFDSQYLYTYDGSNFNALQIDKGVIMSNCTVDNDGRIFVFKYLENGIINSKVYKDNQLVGEYNSYGKPYQSGYFANGGVIMVGYSPNENANEPSHYLVVSYS